MTRLIGMISAILLSSACGAWVTKYDMESNRLIRADILPESRDQLILAFKSLADKHKFQIVVQKADEHALWAFHVMMRNPAVSVSATNLPRTDYLQVAFFKAVNPDFRPSDVELDAIVDDFINELDSIDGVEVMREQEGVP